MSQTPEFSEAKPALLEKYLRGELTQTSTAARAITQRVQESPPPSTDSRAPLVPLQTDGSNRPFFYLHVHWVGSAFYSFIVARDLGSNQPFYVLDPYKFDGLRVPPTIEAMATSYIESIRSIQPEGPYLMGAFCGAGLIAYEMAQQLRAEGQVVDLLVLIDPMAGPIRLIRLLGGFMRRVGGLIGLGPDKQLDWFLRLRYVSRVLRGSKDEYTEDVVKLIKRWQDENPRRFSFVPAPEALRQDWMGIFIWAVSGYVPRHYPGKVTYFFARENPAGRRLWWGGVTEGEKAEIHVIPGTHETCRTEYIHDLAGHLKTCLDKAEASL